VKVQIKVAQDNKVAMLETIRAARTALHNATHPVEETDDLTDEEASHLPELKYSLNDTEGWITFDKPALFVYAGQGPYVGR
jgi:sphingosine kinase